MGISAEVPYPIHPESSTALESQPKAAVQLIIGRYRDGDFGRKYVGGKSIVNQGLESLTRADAARASGHICTYIVDTSG